MGLALCGLVEGRGNGLSDFLLKKRMDQEFVCYERNYRRSGRGGALTMMRGGLEGICSPARPVCSLVAGING
jgi:hypothetical protein